MEKVFQLGTAGVCVDGPEREKNSKKRRRWKKKLERNRNKDTGVKGKERKKTVEERGPMGQRRKKKRLLRGG